MYLNISQFNDTLFHMPYFHVLNGIFAKSADSHTKRQNRQVGYNVNVHVNVLYRVVDNDANVSINQSVSVIYDKNLPIWIRRSCK